MIGQLLVGIFLGTAGFNLVHPDILVEDFSEIGVILLMFLAGIESDLSLLKKYFRPGMYVAVLGILFPVLLGTLGGLVFQIQLNESFFLGLILAATSVSISVEVLKELNVINTKEGSAILGASVVGDILVVLIVSLSMSYLVDFIGLSSVIGAFFTGVAIGQTKDWKDVQVNVEAIGYAVFIPVFFVSIGLEVSFAGISRQLLFILLLTIIAIASKLAGGFIGGKLAGFGNNSSLMVGSGMVSRGEMALIIVQLGYQSGLVRDHYYSAFILIILFTTLASPFLLKSFTRKIY